MAAARKSFSRSSLPHHQQVSFYASRSLASSSTSRLQTAAGIFIIRRNLELQADPPEPRVSDVSFSLVRQTRSLENLKYCLYSRSICTALPCIFLMKRMAIMSALHLGGVPARKPESLKRVMDNGMCVRTGFNYQCGGDQFDGTHLPPACSYSNCLIISCQRSGTFAWRTLLLPDQIVNFVMHTVANVRLVASISVRR